MSDDATTPEGEPTEEHVPQLDDIIANSDDPNAAPAVDLGSLPMIVIPAVVILGGAIALWVLRDSIFPPRLVQVSGIVYMNGEPLANANIRTLPFNFAAGEASGLNDAEGVSDTEGRFTLSTFEGGEPLEGAYVGDHKVTVAVTEPGPGGFGVVTLSPAEYADSTTTTLRIAVSSSADENQSFKLELEGEIKGRKTDDAISGGTQGMMQMGAGMMVGRAFTEGDSNKDGKLDQKEIKALDEQDRKQMKLAEADTNKDGFVDREELNKIHGVSGGGGRGGAGGRGGGRGGAGGRGGGRGGAGGRGGGRGGGGGKQYSGRRGQDGGN